MEKLSAALSVLVQKPWMKIKAFLTAFHDRHTVIFKITLAVLTALSFMVLFMFMPGFKFSSSWQLAVLIVPLIYVHELGHAWAMKKCGVPTKGIYFIPFLGALTASPTVTDINKAPSRAAEAFIYLMGPVAGLALAAIALVAYMATGMSLFVHIIFWSVMLNLFNLIPLVPLDGGGVLKAIGFSIRPWFGLGTMIAGIIALIVLSFIYLQGWFAWLIILVVLLMALADFRREYVLRNIMVHRPMSVKIMLVFICAYLVSIAIFCGMIYLISP